MISRSRKGGAHDATVSGDAPAAASAEQVTDAPADGSTSDRVRRAAQERSSRRRMIARAGGVAAATVAGLTLLDTRRAEAATGGNFILGQSNNANNPTVLTPTTSGVTLNPLFWVNGSNLSSTSTTVEIDASQGATGLVVTASNLGHTRTGLAIAASASGNAVGIFGNSGSNTGVAGKSTSGTGVAGQSTSGAGVRGTGKRGGDFSGTAAAARLRPATTSHPTSGSAGDVFVDKNHHLWFCRGGTTWVKLA